MSVTNSYIREGKSATLVVQMIICTTSANYYFIIIWLIICEPQITKRKVTCKTPGQGLRNKKDRGACQKFWKRNLGGAKILFCGFGLNFSPPRDSSSETTQLLNVHSFTDVIRQKLKISWLSNIDLLPYFFLAWYHKRYMHEKSFCYGPFYNNCLVSHALIGSFLSSIRVRTDKI